MVEAISLAVIKIAEKVAELLVYRSARRKDRFRAVIEPMYTSLQGLHKDYLQMFEKVRQDLQAGVDLHVIAHELARHRIEHEAARRSVQGLARQLKFLEFKEFLVSVEKYFDHPFPPPSVRRDSASIQLLNRLEFYARLLEQRRRRRSEALKIDGALVEGLYDRGGDPHDKGPAFRAVDQVLEQLRTDWNRVTEAYAKALEASLR